VLNVPQAVTQHGAIQSADSLDSSLPSPSSSGLSIFRIPGYLPVASKATPGRLYLIRVLSSSYDTCVYWKCPLVSSTPAVLAFHVFRVVVDSKRGPYILTGPVALVVPRAMNALFDLWFRFSGLRLLANLSRPRRLGGRFHALSLGQTCGSPLHCTSNIVSSFCSATMFPISGFTAQTRFRDPLGRRLSH
jgi:hypothetical protein